eukprot:CAMPEP_0194484026 /NCGR_PEP_ID=MMETSP0253-20130528/5482_1 /TAXON_ID=2966 /ORGANISM="Noctiluca scintillans" /LENGTH=187 /DNA_ID=CAMNT_0039323773 /DNA_START=37 /DNA_END=598 /DNA_ORIENTATION=-
MALLRHLLFVLACRSAAVSALRWQGSTVFGDAKFEEAAPSKLNKANGTLVIDDSMSKEILRSEVNDTVGEFFSASIIEEILSEVNETQNTEERRAPSGERLVRVKPWLTESFALHHPMEEEDSLRMTRMESGWRRVAVLTLFHRGTHRLVMIETRVEAAGSLVDLYDVVSVRVWLRCTHLAETQKKT